jgi:hypothetical protein
MEEDEKLETDMVTTAANTNVRGSMQNGEPMCAMNGRIVKCNPSINVQLLNPNVPAVTDPKICVVFWNSNVDPQVKNNMGNYISSLMGTDYFDGLSEYGMKTRPVMHSACGNGITLTPRATDSETCTEGKIQHRCVSERSLQVELTTQIANGVLPMPNKDIQYLVFFPHNVMSHLGDCAINCGVHGYNSTRFGPLIYAVLPDIIHSNRCQQGCSRFVNTYLDAMKVVLTHEIIEIITDPQPSMTSVSWYDMNWGEICDFCAYPGSVGSIFPTTHWWSRQAGKCVTVHRNSLAGNTRHTCPPSSPINCNNGFCCEKNYTCLSGGKCQPPSSCPKDHPVNCGKYCCPSNSMCDNGSCYALSHVGLCPTGYSIDCKNGFCCKSGQTCSATTPGKCDMLAAFGRTCPPEFPSNCGTGFCCASNEICHIKDNVTSCLPASHSACPTDFPTDCGNGFCCPSGKICTESNTCSNP